MIKSSMPAVVLVGLLSMRFVTVAPDVDLEALDGLDLQRVFPVGHSLTDEEMTKR